MTFRVDVGDAFEVRDDCRFYLGEKPCRFRRLCRGCPHYEPLDAPLPWPLPVFERSILPAAETAPPPYARVLVIKLAAMGDVVRTIPIAEAIRRRHANCRLTWVVDAPTAPLLRGADTIDEVIEYSEPAVAALLARRFDELYCLDKELRAIALGARVHAPRKKGFTISAGRTLTAFDDDARDALRLGLDDPFKFLENTKTYQQIIFEAAGLSFRDEPIRLGLTPTEREEADNLLARLGPGPYIGINTGAGRVFATKRLPEDTTALIARGIATELGVTPLILGGPDETDRNARIISLAGVGVDAGTHHPIRRFAAIVSRLCALVCVDTLALHLAVAEGVPTVALFGPTCHQEVHLYGRGEKIVSAPWCAPCYKSACDHHTCMREITPELVIRTLVHVMAGDARSPVAAAPPDLAAPFLDVPRSSKRPD